MHKEILITEQKNLLPFIKSFSNDFGLVGGTAIALHIGHRKSVDFDLFSNKEFTNRQIRNKIIKNKKKIEHVFVDEKNEFTVLIDGVKCTFLYYPFKIKFSKKLEDKITLPDLLTLSAMKAYTLGRRNKWKDYVDLYFIMKNHYSIEKITKKAKLIFGNEFNEKIFKVQLAYFEDIDYSEKVIFTKTSKVSDTIIKKELTKFSLSP